MFAKGIVRGQGEREREREPEYLHHEILSECVFVGGEEGGA